jgi:hypothetical protein
MCELSRNLRRYVIRTSLVRQHTDVGLAKYVRLNFGSIAFIPIRGQVNLKSDCVMVPMILLSLAHDS